MHPAYRFLLNCLPLLLLAAWMASGCGIRQQPLPQALLLHNYAGYIPATVLTAFTRETGIPVTLIPYEAPEDAAAALQAGTQYDLAIMENRLIPALIDASLLAPLNHSLIPNFKNISLNFRDLVYDPGNRYTVPFNWGTTGMMVRTDLVAKPVTRWADLWDADIGGKVALWRGQPREVIGLTLKSLGYSANEASPAALAEVHARLLELRPRVLFIEDYSPVTAAPLLSDGTAAISMAYAGDVLPAREAGAPIEYVLPAEGALLWGDNYVVPAASHNQAAAMQLINFLLRPDIGAEIMRITYYASANEAAIQALPPALAEDPIFRPSQAVMQQAEIMLPLAPSGEAQVARIWAKFVAGAP